MRLHADPVVFKAISQHGRSKKPLLLYDVSLFSEHTHKVKTFHFGLIDLIHLEGAVIK